MRTLHFLCFALILGVGVLSCRAQRSKSYTGSSHFITKQVAAAGDFQKIRLKGSSDVEYRQVVGAVNLHSATPLGNLVDLLEVEVTGNVLYIKYKDNVSISGNRHPKIIASSSGLKDIRAVGAGDVKIKSPLNGDNLVIDLVGSGDLQGDVFDFKTITINIAGSGDVTLNKLTCDRFKTVIKGSGDIRVAGSAKSANFNVSGSGDISAGRLVADEVSATVRGSGEITCHAVEVMDGDARGSGTIRYYGNPKKVSMSGRKGSVRKH